MTSESCPKIGENPVFASLKPVDIISSHYNVRLKLYPDPEGEARPVELLALSRPVYNPEGWELVGRDAPPPPLAAGEEGTGEEGEPPQQQRSPADERRSKRRSRAAVWDYVQCNPELDTFVTLTLSARSVDRYDYSAIVALLRGWLSNRVQRSGLRYILVPEHHKDGAIHWHGLCNAAALSLTPTGLFNADWERPIWRVGDYPFGRTQAVIIGEERERSARYCCKYISKTDERCGGRRYLHGASSARRCTDTTTPTLRRSRPTYPANTRAAHTKSFASADGRVNSLGLLTGGG